MYIPLLSKIAHINFILERYIPSYVSISLQSRTTMGIDRTQKVIYTRFNHMSIESQEDLNLVLRQIRFSPTKRTDVFLSLSHTDRAQILLHLTRQSLKNLLTVISDDEIVQTLEHLDPDTVTDIIQVFSFKRQKMLLDLLSERLKNDVQILFEFDPNTAAGIMSLDYIQVEENELISNATEKFKQHEKRTGKPPVIVIVKNGQLSGFLPGHELGFRKPEETVGTYSKKIIGINQNANKKNILELFKANPHSKVAVIGESGAVIGIIYSDDVLRLLDEQESASLYDFAGVQHEESVLDNTKAKVRSRYKWLIINLGTAFLASFTVGMFEDTISKFVLLAVYMPIVAGMGGNAATQTLAVLVRGIALKQIDLDTAWPALVQEVQAGLINGLINGVIVATVVLLFHNDIWLALVLGLAMIINLMVAGFFGTIVPLIMQRLGKDPATSATIFITTATDVLGFIAFLGLASLLLK